MLLNRRGFTLTELLIALVLMGIVSAAIYSVLVNNQRLYRQQTLQIELNDNLRSAVAILPADLRELNSLDLFTRNNANASDIQEMTDSSIVYKAMRSLYFICQPVVPPPPTAPTPIAGGSLTLDANWFGLRALDRQFDSLLVFDDRNTTMMTDDLWLHVDVTDVQTGTNCPNNTPSVTVQITPLITPGAAPWDSVFSGAPVRGFEMVEVRRYQDVAGDTWLGQRRWSKGTGWSALQPIAGPLQPNGFQLAYFGVDGLATAIPRQVARVDITVIGRTSQPVNLGGGGVGYAVDTLFTRVALRNR